MIQRLKRKRKYKYMMIAAVVLVAAFAGIFLPGSLLKWRSGQQMNEVAGVPAEYYSPANLAVARKASANLGTYQRLQLIAGEWESKVTVAEADEGEIANYAAVAMAKEQLSALYDGGMYPVCLTSDYGNWYNWEAELYKAVDATFHTYTAYYWKLTFSKYDGTEKHLVYMLEDGTVFLADAWVEKGIDKEKLTKVSDLGSFWEHNYEEVVIQKMTTQQKKVNEYLAFGQVDASGLQWLDLTGLRTAERKYYALQLTSADRYLYALQPTN